MTLGEDNANPNNTGNDLLEETERNIEEAKSNILAAQSDINTKQAQIQKKSQLLEEKQKQVYGQSQEINDKIKLLETRNRMLQLSIDRNVYKKKVIYSLLAVIISLVVAMLLIYSFFNKKAMQ